MGKLKSSRLASFAIILSVTVLGLPSVALWMLRARLPEQIATHFGADGAADGWSSLSAALLWPMAFGLGMALFLVAIGHFMRSMRFMGPFAVGMSAMLAIVGYGSILGQIDGGTPDVGPLIFVGVLVMVTIPVIGWWWLKDRMEPTPVEKTGTFAASLPGHPDVRSWSGETRRGKTPVVVAVIVSLVGIFMMVLFRHEPWLMATMGLLIFGMLPLLFLSQQHVRIDADGVSGTSLGIRVHHTPLDDILSAGHVQVDPLGDFGGAGFRSSIDGHREGVVTGAGEALIFQRRGQKDFVITVEDAVGASRVLAMLVQERRVTSG